MLYMKWMYICSTAHPVQDMGGATLIYSKSSWLKCVMTTYMFIVHDVIVHVKLKQIIVEDKICMPFKMFIFSRLFIPIEDPF